MIRAKITWKGSYLDSVKTESIEIFAVFYGTVGKNLCFKYKIFHLNDLAQFMKSWVFFKLLLSDGHIESMIPVKSIEISYLYINTIEMLYSTLKYLKLQIKKDYV